VIDRYSDQGDLFIEGERLLLTPKGRRFADRIASDLFLAADEWRPPAAPSTGAAEEDGHG